MWLSVNETSRVESSSEVKRKSRKKRNIAIGVLVLVIILLLLIQNFLSVPEGSNQKTDPIARPGIGEIMEGDLPNMSDEQLREYLKNKQDASLFTVAVNAEATFEKGSTILNLMVANVEKNIVDCYFEILDKDEVIYTSPIMKPNQYIQTAELTRELTEDVNDLIVRYKLIYQDNIIGEPEVGFKAISKPKKVIKI